MFTIFILLVETVQQQMAIQARILQVLAVISLQKAMEEDKMDLHLFQGLKNNIPHNR